MPLHSPNHQALSPELDKFRFGDFQLVWLIERKLTIVATILSNLPFRPVFSIVICWIILKLLLLNYVIEVGNVSHGSVLDDLLFFLKKKHGPEMIHFLSENLRIPSRVWPLNDFDFFFCGDHFKAGTQHPQNPTHKLAIIFILESIPVKSIRMT